MKQERFEKSQKSNFLQIERVKASARLGGADSAGEESVDCG